MRLNQQGMTLIEILVALGLMSILTIFITQTVSKGATSKVKIEKNIARYSVVRDALKIMEADINRAFNYRDINIELYNEAMKERQERQQEARNNQNNENDSDDNDGSSTITGGDENDDDNGNQAPVEEIEPFEPREYTILTHFIGDADEMHFTSLNNIRTTAGVLQSDQMEVGYYLGSCRGRIDKRKQSNCLWRRKSSILDDDVEQGGIDTVLLENVSSMKLRFLEGPSPEQLQPQWKADWNSTGAKEPRLTNHFPAAVEITLEVQNKDAKGGGKKTAMTLVAQIRNPNNPQPEKQVIEDGQNGQPGGTNVNP
ncbi:MAG: prepilin-type N-terminal cleavage/methylation domain-containing protein [Bdellovibrionales bacterium]|nr:prepilin-type N-terminal cleavage/methylation domain-containing protein [Bdellovibrionales bacterium]